MAQKFKGDETELKFEAAGTPALELTSGALDSFYSQGFDCNPFLLMLYDEGRMPFSDRIPRESFVDFIKEALINFNSTGTFDAYIFILKKVFGEASTILFEVPGNGKLSILINASTELEFDAIVHEYEAGEFSLTTSDDDGIVFRGISGIDSEYRLKLLLSELIPTGVFTEFTLSFFALFDFYDDAGDGMTDYLGNQIVFFETGE